MTTTQILEIIIRALPYPNQINQLELDENAVRFSWRSQRFRVDTALHANTIGDVGLIGDDAAILLRALLVRESLEGA